MTGSCSGLLTTVAPSTRGGAVLTRRVVLGAAAALAAPAIVRAAEPLSVFSHKVHQAVAVGQAGDITAAFTKETGVPVQWTTFGDNGLLGERVLREASLDHTGVDVGFLLNTQIVPRVAGLFEVLDPWMAKAPVAAPEDVFPGLWSGMKVAGQQVGLPFRQASSGLHYNEAILAERGIDHGPGSVEELIEMIRRCTWRRADGTRVVGLMMPGMSYPNVIDLARAWDGDFITLDFKCTADGPGMMNAIKLLRALYQEGAFPRNFTTLTTEDTTQWVQQGRVAFVLQSMSRNRLFNDPKGGAYAGKIRTVAMPSAAALKGKYPVAPTKVEFWGMAIPRTAQRKELSWALMRSMLTPEATLIAALNGNGPVRNSTYENAQFRATVPYADEERRVLKVARVPLPAFDEAARAGDLFKEEAEAAVLGLKTPEQAMGDLVKRVTPLLPA